MTFGIPSTGLSPSPGFPHRFLFSLGKSLTGTLDHDGGYSFLVVTTVIGPKHVSRKDKSKMKKTKQKNFYFISGSPSYPQHTPPFTPPRKRCG